MLGCVNFRQGGMLEIDQGVSKLPMRWLDLPPDPEIVAALDIAGTRPQRLNAEQRMQDQRREWSAKFARACSVAIANEVRRCPGLPARKKVLPLSLEEGTEPVTPLGGGTSKRIDVTVADPVLGLELGFSLKGLNFKDEGSGNYDKNLTGRLYELGDEVRLVHEHLPHAFMVGLFFLPVESTVDKANGTSSFAHALIRLRERTGRLDFAIAAHAPRCDAGWVCLYTIGDEPQRFPRGVARFINVDMPPPRRGRPQPKDTYSLEEMVAKVVGQATYQEERLFSEPENDVEQDGPA